MARRRDSVLAALEVFRELNPNLWLSNLIVFLYVCENEGLNVRELAQVGRLHDATASRAVRALLAKDEPGALPPYAGLVEMFQNPSDGRGRLIFLSEEGRRLRNRIDGFIRDAIPIQTTESDARINLQERKQTSPA